MKEFIKSQKITYNLMSFTGFKSLLMFTILVEGPKSFDDIISIIENHPYLREKVSVDTIRVYINSLKRLGCNVKRVRGADKVSRYYIESHPFELNLSDDEIKSVVKVYKMLVKSMDVEDLLYMDNLFEKIGKYILNDDFIGRMRKISMLGHADKKILKELIQCCDKKLQVKISYKSPKSGIKDIDIVTDKIEIREGKIYLCGYGFEYNEYGIFLIDRIKQIKEIKEAEELPQDLKEIRVVYKIEASDKDIKLSDNEKIIKKQRNKVFIEVHSYNKFMLKQKFLELADECVIVEPEDFKQEFIKTLKDMKAGYYCGC